MPVRKIVWPTRLQVLLGCAHYHHLHAIGTPACPACPPSADVYAALTAAYTSADRACYKPSDVTRARLAVQAVRPVARHGAQRCHGVPPPRLWVRGCGGYRVGSLPCGRGGCCVGGVPGGSGGGSGHRQQPRPAGYPPGSGGQYPRPRPPASAGCDF